MDAPVDRAPIEMEEAEPAESESSSKEMKASKTELVSVGFFLIGSSSTKQRTQNKEGGVLLVPVKMFTLTLVTIHIQTEILLGVPKIKNSPF